jgi:hypothetical protein
VPQVGSDEGALERRQGALMNRQRRWLSELGSTRRRSNESTAGGTRRRRSVDGHSRVRRPGDPVLVAQAKTELIEINSAKAEELVTLKGIGEPRAKAIIKGRPYARKDDLVRKKVVPLSIYDDIKDSIVAKQ